MKDEDMLKLDFNSLKVLKVLGEEKNTKRAADRLFLTPSAVSKALSRLREQFDDKLFERSGRDIEPTEKCQRLLSRIPSLIESLDELYAERNDFDPQRYSGEINIHLNSNISFGVMTKLFSTLHEKAPNATLSLHSWSEQTETLLKLGSVDVGINFYPLDISKEIVQFPISSPKVKLCVHESHPLTKIDKVAISDVVNYPAVMVSQPNFLQKRNKMAEYFAHHGYTIELFLQSDKADICLETVRKIPCFMGVTELVREELFEGLTLIDVDHWGMSLIHR